MHTFRIYCSFADKLSIQTQLWLLVVLLAIPAWKKSKTLRWSLLKMAYKITSFPHRKRKFMSLKGEMIAEFNDVDKKVF